MAVIRQMSEGDMAQVRSALAANVHVQEDLLASYYYVLSGAEAIGAGGGLGAGSIGQGPDPLVADQGAIGSVLGEYADPDYPVPAGGGPVTSDFRDLLPGETPYSHPGITHAQHPETHPLGEDFYDENAEGPGGGAGGGLLAVGAGVALSGLLRPAIATLRALMGRATRITQQHWERLPTWAQQALSVGGIFVGTDLAMDIPGIPGDSMILGGIEAISGNGHGPPHFAGGVGVSIIGGWQANGVQFYRLSNGYFAVQNKKGRWKTWKPKKPIVMYSSGASNLRTLLRADKAVDNQLKKLKKAINRRNPARRQSKPRMIDGATGSIIQVR